MRENSTDVILQRQKLNKLSELLNTHKKIVDACIILVVSIAVFVKAFGSYELMKYIDGGYYILEVKTLINSGKLYYEAPPLFFIIASMFSVISNLELGLRIASAFIVSVQVPSFFISLYLVKGRKEAYFTLPFTIWNTNFYKMYGNLAKNLLGLAFIPIILAMVWIIWQKNEKLIIYFIVLFMSTFCLTISHLPSTLIGVMSVGVFILLLVLKTLLKTYIKIPKDFKNIKNQLRTKEFRALTTYPMIRIAIAVIIISFSLLLGVVLDNVFPHIPNTWYSSSEIPSENYGNANEELVLLLSRFFLILLKEPVIILALLGILFLLRPKSWEIPVAVVLAISSISFSISSNSWLPRIVLDLEVGRIFLYAICLGGITDFLAKYFTYFFQKILSRIRKIRIIHTFNFKSFYVVLSSIIFLATFSTVNSISFSITNDRFFMSEQFLEEYSTLGNFVVTYEENPLVYAAHGEEFWFTVETGVEAKSTTSWNDFVELMHEMTSYKKRSVFLLYPRNIPPVIGNVSLISIEKFQISGQWGYIMAPRNMTFIGDYNYSFSMSFNFPSSKIKNATMTIWQLLGDDKKELIHTEVLKVVEDGTTKSRISNNPDVLRDICYEFSWLLMSIQVDFVNSSTQPFEVLLAVYGGIAPFEIVNQGSFYTLFKLNNNFSLMGKEKYSTPYPNFASQLHLPPPPNQPHKVSTETLSKSLFLNFLSPIVLWPFLISDNFYIKLLVSLPITIFQLYFVTFMILLCIRMVSTLSQLWKKVEP